jgi:hypothetical protein
LAAIIDVHRQAFNDQLSYGASECSTFNRNPVMLSKAKHPATSIHCGGWLVFEVLRMQYAA